MKSCRTLLLIVVSLVYFATQFTFAAPQAKGAHLKKIALVIGNARYVENPLANPVNDANDIATMLRKLDFDVIEKTNLSQKEMNKVIGEFGNKLNKNSIALFYYAGHGLQVKGKNYLVPVDASIGAETQVRAESIDLDTVFDQMETTATSIVILDACRNNPFERKMRGGASGLAMVDAPQGMIIAYSTAPGKVALDGSGRNGVYTQELIKALDVPNQSIEQVFKKVRSGVVKQTDGVQVPWESSSLTGDFYFVQSAQVNSNDVDKVVGEAVRKANEKSEAQIKELQGQLEKLVAQAIERQNKELSSLKVETKITNQTNSDNKNTVESASKDTGNAVADERIALSKQAPMVTQINPDNKKSIETARKDAGNAGLDESLAVSKQNSLNKKVLTSGKKDSLIGPNKLAYTLSDEYTSKKTELDIQSFDAPNGGKLLKVKVGNGNETDYYVNEIPVFIKTGLDSEVVLAPYANMQYLDQLKFNHARCMVSRCYVDVKTLGRESIEVDGGRRDAFVFEVVAHIRGGDQNSTGALIYKFWYDDERRILLKQRAHSTGFAAGSVKFYDSVAYMK